MRTSPTSGRRSRTNAVRPLLRGGLPHVRMPIPERTAGSAARMHMAASSVRQATASWPWHAPKPPWWWCNSRRRAWQRGAVGGFQTRRAHRALLRLFCLFRFPRNSCVASARTGSALVPSARSSERGLLADACCRPTTLWVRRRARRESSAVRSTHSRTRPRLRCVL